MINLVMEHSQRGNVFALWAKYELLGQDEKLVEQYNIRKYVLVEGDVRHDRERASKLAAALAVGVFCSRLLLLSGLCWQYSWLLSPSF